MEENWDEDWDGQPPPMTSYQQAPQYQPPPQYNNNNNSWRNRDNNERRHGENGAGGRGRRNDGRRDRNQSHQASMNQLCETLKICSVDVPRVIGRGGSTVKGVEEQFRVRVKIDQNIDYEGYREARITGSNREDVLAAKEHIAGLVPENEPAQQPAQQPTPVQTEQKFELINWDALEEQTNQSIKEKFGHLPPVEKHFYEECDELKRMTVAEVDRIRELNNKISVQRNFTEDVNRDIPKPITKFEHCFAKYPEILAEFRKMNYKQPTPIQAQAWPILMSGNDMIGIAQTGTGKTLAFIIPAMIHTELQTVPRSKRTGPTVCILAPTRELALQIKSEVEKFHFRGMRAVCIYGGASRKEQIDLVTRGVEIVIATPGRLNDLLDSNIFDMKSVSYVVLDEADRMLDMGFEPQIQRILLQVRPDRQTVMTSATWPAGVRRLAKNYMKEPVQVVVGSLDLAAVTSVTQHIRFVPESEKYDEILEFARQMEPGQKAIIFCGKKLRADDLSSEFSMMGINCSCIHGQRDQKDREQAIADIKSGFTTMLIATDVASRGIDIEDITHVVNYDFPKNIEEYVHRVGRTGRAGRKGIAISYFNRGDLRNAADLIKILEDADQVVPRKLREWATAYAREFDDDDYY